MNSIGRNIHCDVCNHPGDVGRAADPGMGSPRSIHLPMECGYGWKFQVPTRLLSTFVHMHFMEDRVSIHPH